MLFFLTLECGFLFSDMYNDRAIKQREVFLVWLLLCISVIFFNYYDIFVLKSLYMDDHHRLLLGYENKIHTGIFQRNSLRAYVIWPLYKLLSIDIVYARFMQTLVFYIPLALAFYWLYRKYAGITRWPAFTASLLPAILPGQTMIPSFIDGSYTVQGLLVFLLAMFAAFRFLRHSKLSFLWLFLTGLIYFASVEMMDQAIFMAPVLIVFCFLLFSNPINWKKLISVSGLIISLAIMKAIYQSINPAAVSAVPVDPSWEQFISRLLILPTYTFPFSHNLGGRAFTGKLLWVVYGVILFAGVINGNKKQRRLIYCGLFWAFFAIITFLSISRGFAPRLSHIGAWGLVFSLVISIVAILDRLQKSRWSVPLVLCSLILYAGYTRLEAMKIFAAPRNEVMMAAEQLYANKSWPEDAQIMLINVPPWISGGWWVYSKGFLKLLTGRNDLTGVVGWEKYFYDPFTPKNRGFNSAAKMAGIDPDKPVFIYRLIRKPPYHFIDVPYVLKWKEGSWNLSKLNKQNGSFDQVLSGISKEDFIYKIQSANIDITNIAFAK